ncbi:MAG TPA: hypothetical protein VF812_12950 [Ktedonobacterales bacterium]
MATVTVTEMALSGGRSSWSFDTSDERLTLRDIIRWRVREEVARRKLAAGPQVVQPTTEERALNGARPQRMLALDWEQEYARALEAFTAHHFIAMVADRQVDDLDALVPLGADCEVTFLRLTPLVGG